MYKTIVITHGKLAVGLKDTLTMITGEKEGVYFVTFDPSDSVDEFDKRFRTIYRSIPKEESILIMADIYGGTPMNVATKNNLREPHRVQVITGMNLPLLLSAVLSQEKDLFSCIDGMLEEAKQQIIKIEHAECAQNEDDE